ncbi:MAG: hypothetical protein VX130_06750 [Verrucomicrobiota bacterium]|nr:hypothetical protein [Verrucomicrobiota bacterium]
MPTQLPQQKATCTFFLAGLPENGHSLLFAFVFFIKDLRSEDAFLAQLLQQTLNDTTLSAFTALPEKGHFSLTGASFFAPIVKMEIARIARKLNKDLKLIFIVLY